MDGDDRKAAIAAYKERKGAVGIFAVRCAASGAVWVGQSLNLDTVRNRIWFTLRLGSAPRADLQRAWRDHGADSFSFAVLEQLAEEESSYLRDAMLKARLAHWRTTLGGAAM